LRHRRQQADKERRMGYVVDTLKCYFKIAGVAGVLRYVGSKASRKAMRQRLQAVDRKDLKAPIYLRIPSSDVLTYWQVFVDHEYALKTNSAPAVIVDAGANVGLASVYFANRFPDARIFAIEPEQSNFDVLLKNVAPYKNVVPILAALWNENKQISLVDPGLGNSGFMTEDGGANDQSLGQLLHLTKAMTVDQVMREHAIAKIDILKVDIEGAEREVFSDPSSWIGKVDSLIVELHDRMKPGCNQSFSAATRDFGLRWTKGENVIISRPNGCLNNLSST
jgi:FkbM family methyltransferase